jgi:hypothetical protein
METFSAALPELASEVARCLAGLGDPQLARRFGESPVRSVTARAKAAYIQLGPDPHASGRTLALQESRMGIVLDIADDGTPIGVEVLAASGPLKTELRRRAAA